MPHKGPHISIAPDFVVNRILRINLEDFADWPESVRHLATEIAEELFLVAYNPFVDSATVKASVKERFDREVFALAHHYANTIGEGITLFWSGHEAEVAFRKELVERLGAFLPPDAIVTRPSALVACATDATDLRMELPLMVVEPANAEQVSELVKLANELKFALIPRGGASGLTGGSVPMRRRSVIVRTTRFTKMSPVDHENMSVTLDAGVITQAAIDAVAKEGFLFTVDPASKTASTIGGNVAENSGGPFAFEYGTTLDNLLSWRMVTPTGEIISIERKNHPRHKILPDEVAVFEVKDISGGVRSVVELHGSEIRLPGLGKDVTNKALGGLPGMQKEGVDGIITDATFIVHKKPAQSRVMVLEFYGRSMHQAAVVIGQIVDLRNRIREEGDYARLSALEEFNAKYVRAIEYQKKFPFPSSSFRWTATSRTCWRSAFRKSWISWPRTTTWRSSWRRMRRKPNFSGKIATVFPPSPAGRPDSRSTRTWSFPCSASRISRCSSNSSIWNARLPHTVRRCRSWGVCPAWRWRTRISTANSSM